MENKKKVDHPIAQKEHASSSSSRGGRARAEPPETTPEDVGRYVGRCVGM